jgi:hypothetical protein
MPDVLGRLGLAAQPVLDHPLAVDSHGHRVGVDQLDLGGAKVGSAGDDQPVGVAAQQQAAHDGLQPVVQRPPGRRGDQDGRRLKRLALAAAEHIDGQGGHAVGQQPHARPHGAQPHGLVGAHGHAGPGRRARLGDQVL